MPRTKTTSTPKTPPMDLQGFVTALNSNEELAQAALRAQVKEHDKQEVRASIFLGLIMGAVIFFASYALGGPPQASLTVTFIACELAAVVMVFPLFTPDSRNHWLKPLSAAGRCQDIERLVNENPDLNLLPAAANGRQLYYADFLLAQQRVNAAKNKDVREREACARLHSQTGAFPQQSH